MMAANNEAMRDPEFEAAFNEDQGASASAADSGGMNLPEAGEGTPAEEAADAAETVSDAGDEDGGNASPAVVIVAEVEPGAQGSAEEQAENDKAAKQAQAVNDQANAEASTNGSTAQTTGEKEANGASAPEGSAEEEAGETPAQEAAEVAAGAGDGSDKKTPMTEQQLRSWEGRLKKMEADLKAKAVAGGDKPSDGAADAIEQVSSQAEDQGNTDLAEAAESVAAQVDAGTITPDEAIRQLAEDFGEPFVRMIQAIAQSTAGETANKAVGDRLGKLEQDTQDVINHLTNSAQRAHYQEIFDAHPDFQEVGEDPAFKEFAASTGQQEVVEKGSAAQINKLISDYKASKQAPAQSEQEAAGTAAAPPESAPVDQSAVDAAEGVRSAGLRLPEKPGKANDDFASAWNEF